MGKFITHMKEKRKIALEAFLAENPVFRLEEYAEAQGRPQEPTRNQIKYHVRRGRVKRVAAGVYAAVPFGQDPRAFWPDPVLVAACLQPCGVFSHHTALELLGAGHSAWNVCTLFCERPPAPQPLGEQRIHFLSFPSALVRKKLTGLGVRHLDRRGRQVTCTGPERTLVEGFRQPRWAGGLEELVESASGFPSLDLDLLERVLKAYDQSNLWSAAGWFLERYQERFFVPEAFLTRLERCRPSKPRYLVRSERGGTLVRRWNLVVSSRLLQWEGQRAQP
ncbi:MAG: hypothetical protein EXS64_19445 [Candidatus Latescibacteria bacterium]|nr:hypothetical protein [Candidatus Latescibacterota bacterium]